MGLYKYSPEPSGRMGLLWTIGLIADAVVLEFGSMGHMLYAEKWLLQTAISPRAKVYTTHIDEKNIALGITQSIEDAVDEIMEKDSPKALFLLPSSIPEIIGVDLEVIGRDLQLKYPSITIINLKKGGFREKYNEGIEEALYKIVKFIPKETKQTTGINYNIIGSCADLNKFQSDARELSRILDGALKMSPTCVLSSDTSIDKIQNMGSADINLVIRKEGLKAAQELEQKFNTPYIYARPYGYEGTKKWLIDIARILKIPLDHEFIQREISEGLYATHYCKQMFTFHVNKAMISIGGNIDVVQAIMNFACDELGMKKKYIWCDCKKHETEEIPYWDEGTWMKNIDKDVEGMIMSKKEVLAKAGRSSTMIINRGLDSWNFNWYSSPFMGFRGAMNLCSLWLEDLLDN